MDGTDGGGVGRGGPPCGCLFVLLLGIFVAFGMLGYNAADQALMRAGICLFCF